jgi:hypothetical protein
MDIADLKQTCPACKGSGQQPGISNRGVREINVDGRCLACEGRGFRLTVVGQDLVRLLRPFIEDLVHEELRGLQAVPPPKPPS